MENWLTAAAPVLLKTIASALGIMLIILAVVRTAGLRTFAKMSSFDFASTVAIGSIMATVVMNTGQSLLKAGVAMATVVGFQQFFAYLKRQSRPFENAVENTPVMLMRGNEILNDNLARTGVTRSDLLAKLREANVIQLTEVKAVILETTGDISVLHSDGNEEVADILLEGVETYSA